MGKWSQTDLEQTPERTHTDTRLRPMPRDSILDDAVQSDHNETDAEPDRGDSNHTDDVTSQDEDTDRTQFTQRCPPSVLEDVERVQEEYGLPSRNAAINFMLIHAAKDL